MMIVNGAIDDAVAFKGGWHGESLVYALWALALQGATFYPLLKWAVVGAVAVPLCFGLGSLIRKLPYTDRVL